MNEVGEHSQKEVAQFPHSEFQTPAGVLGYESFTWKRDRVHRPLSFERQNVVGRTLDSLRGSEFAGSFMHRLLESLGKATEELPLRHTLNHLREPALFALVGVPVYDTLAMLSIAYYAARQAGEKGVDRAVTEQAVRWYNRLIRQDWLGNARDTALTVKALLENGNPFSAAFPEIVGQQELIKTTSSDAINFYAHNMSLWRSHTPDILAPAVQTDVNLRTQIPRGLSVPNDVLKDTWGVLPAMPEAISSLEMYAEWTGSLSTLLQGKQSLRALEGFPERLDETVQKYTRSLS